MNRSLRVTAWAAALIVVLALSGCGDSATKPEASIPSAPTSTGATGATTATPPSSATGATKETTQPKLSSASKRFAVKLDAICRKYDTSEAEVYYADAVASGEDATADLTEMVSNYRRLLRSASALDPPADSQTSFDAYLDSLRALIKQSGSVPQGLEARNEAAIKLGAGNCLMDSAD